MVWFWFSFDILCSGSSLMRVIKRCKGCGNFFFLSLFVVVSLLVSESIKVIFVLGNRVNR